MDNDSLGSGPCFICYQKISAPAFREDQLQEKQFIAEFLFRKLFDFPDDVCSQLLEKHENTSSWIYWCDSCSVLMKEGKLLYAKFTQLEDRIFRLRRKVEAKISTSEETSNEKIETPNDIDDELTDVIRFLLLSNAQKDDSDLCKVEVKIESDSEIEDQFISGENASGAIEIESEYSNGKIVFNDDNESFNSENSLCKYGSKDKSSAQVKSNSSPKLKKSTLHSSTSQSRKKQNLISDGIYAVGLSEDVEEKDDSKEEECPSFEYLNKVKSEHSNADETLENDRESIIFMTDSEITLNEFENAETYPQVEIYHISPKLNRPTPEKTSQSRRKQTLSAKFEKPAPEKTSLSRRKQTLSPKFEKPVPEKTSQSQGKQSVSPKRLPSGLDQTELDQQIISHVNTVGPLTIFTCSTCGGQFLFESDLAAHQSNCNTEKCLASKTNFQCPRCFKKFLNRFELALHMKLVHTTDKVYPCSFCGLKFQFDSLVKIHEKIHNGERPYLCDICGKGFTKPRVLTKHVRRHKESWAKPHKCSTCGKRFADKYTLRDHEKMHREDNPYRCTVCGKNLSSPFSLSVHMNLHSGEKREKKFPCVTCGKSFFTKANLKTHEKLVHTAKQSQSNVCHFCGKEYLHLASLKAHEKTHTGERTLYPCSFCEKGFSCRRDLTIHERTHTGEPAPYKCLSCDKRFDTKPRVKAHERTHTGDKPYSCTLCDRSFTASTTRDRHKRVVHDKEPGKYHCTICEKRFHGKIDLERHEKSHK